MTEHPAKTYCRCMEDIKLRVGLIRSMLRGELNPGREDFLAEFICIQVRKVLELIAFGSLTANKEAYAQVHSDFASHWNAKWLLAKLEKIHPQFYPRPISISERDEKGGRTLSDLSGGFLTRDELVMLYDRCSEVIHSRNPFRTEPAVINFEKSLEQWVEQIQVLLNVHIMQLAGSEVIWLVSMKDPTDGNVRVAVAAPSDAI